jgi:hypothetical protein
MSAAVLEKKSDAAPAKASKPAPAQGNLRIGPVDDSFEREADRMAERVMAGSRSGPDWSFSRIGIAAPLQRKCSCGGSGGPGGECEECKEKKALQRKANGSAEADVAPPEVNQVLSRSGAPLDRATRSFFEPRFGHDFNRVRVHTDAQAAASARSVNALAYTVGNHIVFGADRFDPAGGAGRKLLAHELVHVTQQQSGKLQRQRAPQSQTGQTGPAEVQLDSRQECEGRKDITQEFKDFVKALPGLLQDAQEFSAEQKVSFKDQLDQVLQAENGVNINTFKVISCAKINSYLQTPGETWRAAVDPGKKEVLLDPDTKKLIDDFKQNKDKKSLARFITTLAHEKLHATLGNALKVDAANTRSNSPTTAENAGYRAEEILTTAEEIAVGRKAYGGSYIVSLEKQQKLYRLKNQIRNWVTDDEFHRLRKLIVDKLRERYGFAHGCDNQLTVGILAAMDHHEWFQCTSSGINRPPAPELHICDDFCKPTHEHTEPRENEDEGTDPPDMLQRKCADCAEETEELNRKPADASLHAVKTAPPIVHQVLNSGGAPLDARTRAEMEASFGRDFSRVRVHTDAQAAVSAGAVNALAYTVDNHIVFGNGRFDPAGAAGRKLLAHELTHVAQQQRANSALVQRQPPPAPQDAPPQKRDTPDLDIPMRDPVMPEQHPIEIQQKDECERRADITKEVRSYFKALPERIQNANDFTKDQKASFKKEIGNLLRPEGGVDIGAFAIFSCDSIDAETLRKGEEALAEIDHDKKEILLTPRLKKIIDNPNLDKDQLVRLIGTLSHEKLHETLGNALEVKSGGMRKDTSVKSGDVQYRAEEIITTAEEIRVGVSTLEVNYTPPSEFVAKLNKLNEDISRVVTPEEYKRLRNIILAKLREQFGFKGNCDSMWTVKVVSAMDHNLWAQCDKGDSTGIYPSAAPDLKICDSLCNKGPASGGANR